MDCDFIIANRKGGGEMTEKISAWSPSTYGAWKECSRKVLYEKVRKLCPVCFTGKIKGGFNGEPITCDSCDKDQPPREALDRGNRLDAALTAYVGGASREDLLNKEFSGPKLPTVGETDLALALDEATRHPIIAKLVKKLRKTKNVFRQARIVVNSAWQRLEEGPERGIWARGVWGRMVLDVLVVGAKKARVIDWKSGNIDRKTGEIRERSEYHDSMRLYQIGVLSSYPKVQEVTAEMAFLDTPPKLDDPFKRLPVLKRAELSTAKAAMEAKLRPMMSDTVFAPRPSYACTWCAFGKSKGGPCEFG